MQSLHPEITNKKTSWRAIALSSQASARSIIDFTTATRLGILPLCVFDYEGLKEIHIGVSDQCNLLELQNDLKLLTQGRTRVSIFPDKDLRQAIVVSYQRTIQENTSHESYFPQAHVDYNSLETRDIPQQFRAILISAFTLGASDIHLSFNTGVIRVRVNGELELLNDHTASTPSLLRHIQTLCNLDTTEHKKPQDGGFSFSINNNTIRARVSVIHLTNNKQVAIRILHHYLLDEEEHNNHLEILGLNKSQQFYLKNCLQKDSGLIIVSGSTGSGKSTLLYSCIELLVSKNKNIISLEDPIEREIQGCTQVEVNSADNSFYLKNLRAILRHDPDVVIVGEIRDAHILEVVIQAALSGILILTTIHASNTQHLLLRLFELGAKPSTLGNILSLCTHQELAPLNCKHCSNEISQDLLPESLREYARSNNSVFLHGDGCGQCSGKGYLGRIGIFESIAPNYDLIEYMNKKFNYEDCTLKVPHVAHAVSFKQSLVSKITQGQVSPFRIDPTKIDSHAKY